jgi:transposase
MPKPKPPYAQAFRDHELVKANQAELPIRCKCETLQVSTSGYYDWLGRSPSARAQANVTLLQSIREAHIASDETYGMPRIRAELADMGVVASRKRIARLMHDISESPTRVRTWALKGQTPIIQFHFNWNYVSVIAGPTRTNCLFRLHEGNIKKEEIVEFLKALKAHLKQPLLVTWDGLKAHRSSWVREYLDGLSGHIQIAFLPPNAPDMNPVEYLWAWLKRHAIANYCPNDLSELHITARNKHKSAQKRDSIIAACWQRATLW